MATQQQQHSALDSVFSAGFMLFRRTPPTNEIEYLLLQSLSGKWGPPKGHVEKGESTYQAAVRETQEEAGLAAAEDFTLIPDFKCEMKYEVNSRRDGHKMKTVTLWLGEMVDMQCAITLSSEHQSYKWSALKEACELVTTESIGQKAENLKKCLEKCEDKIRSF